MKSKEEIEEQCKLYEKSIKSFQRIYPTRYKEFEIAGFIIEKLDALRWVLNLNPYNWL